MLPSVRILSLRIPALSKSEALHLLEQKASSKKLHPVYTPNPQMALRCAHSRALAEILGRASLLLPDGTGLVMASRRLGSPLPERITGIDAGEHLLRYAAQNGLSVALLGARPGVAEQAVKRLKARLTNLDICYTHHGYFEKSGQENEAVIEGLTKAAPDILFVCFGFPQQEKWIDRNAAKIPSLRLCMGLGGALDVWSGNTRRAPKWVQRARCEWLWRTLRDPRRLCNFVDIPLFLLHVEKQRKNAQKKVQ